jgi:hypothetical protein
MPDNVPSTLRGCDASCVVCSRRYFEWVRRQTAMRKRIVRGVGRGTQVFYEHAATSVKPEDAPATEMRRVLPEGGSR